MAEGDAMTEVASRRFVFVDGVNKGEVHQNKTGRWIWHRGPIATETFARGSTLADVAEWARKCCNGKSAEVKGGRS